MAQPIDEGMFVAVNGVEQWVTIRGANRHNPVLLMLSGPGVAFSRLALFFAPWERDYTLVQWDQPGAGATFARNGDTGTGPVTIERIARDGLAVAEFIRTRLGSDRIVLVGVSGGSIVGLRMVKQRPDLFAAYVGTGQIVTAKRQEELSYEMAQSQARARGDQSAVDELSAIGPPPYADVSNDLVKSKHAAGFTPAEQAVFGHLDPAVAQSMRTPPPDARYVPKDLPSEDQRARSLAVFRLLRNEILAFDARTLGLDFGVPMFFIQGDQDAYTVTPEVEKYAADLRAPRKGIVIIKGGGHSTIFLREEFLAALHEVVRP